MRKFFLSFLALAIAVSASAFTLRLQQETVVKEITEAQYYPDLFENGQVEVAFDEAEKTVYVTLRNAELSDLKNHEGCPFSFTGDYATYNKLVILIEGNVEILTVPGSYFNTMSFTDCEVDIISSSMSDKLEIYAYGYGAGVYLRKTTTLNIGNRKKGAFVVNIDSARGISIVGYDSYKQILNIYSALIYLRSASEEKVTAGLEEINLKYNQPLEKGMSIVGAEFVDKNLDPVMHLLSIPGPYAIFFGDEPIYENNAGNFQPTSLVEELGKKGTISYNEETKTITLEDAIVDGDLWIGYDDFTLELKGDNYFRNSANSTTTRIDFAGKNAKITGDENAYLTIKGESKCDGIHAASGLKLNNFKELTIANAINGIVGNKDATTAENELYTDAELSLSVSSKLTKDFSKFTHASGMNEVTSWDETYCHLYYPKFFTFYDKDVTSKNASDIVIVGADGKASYDNATAILTLDNFKNDMIQPAGAIYNLQDDITIQLIGNNKLSASSNVIATDYNLTIEGNGTLEMISSTGIGIFLTSSKDSLSIKNGAEVEISGESGIKANASVTCMPGMDSTDPMVADGQAATLIINNAALKASATHLHTAAVEGFKEIKMTDAKISEPATATAVFMCDGGSNVFAGIVDGDDYAQSVTISKTGGMGINQITNEQSPMTNKIIKDNQLYLMYNGTMYNVQGQKIEN